MVFSCSHWWPLPTLAPHCSENLYLYTFISSFTLVSCISWVAIRALGREKCNNMHFSCRINQMSQKGALETKMFLLVASVDERSSSSSLCGGEGHWGIPAYVPMERRHKKKNQAVLCILGIPGLGSTHAIGRKMGQ